MPSRQTSIRINERLQPILDKYMAIWGGDEPGAGKQSAAIFEAMLRLDTQYKIDQRRLRELFTEEEKNLMLNNALSTAYSPATIPGAVLADTEDEIPATLESFGVHRKTILTKLEGLSTGEQFALVAWLEELRSKA